MCFSLLLVLHSGEYYLFESDSEDEEELQSEDQKPQKQTACQVRRQRRVVLTFKLGIADGRRCNLLFLWSVLSAGLSSLGEQRQAGPQGTAEAAEADEEDDQRRERREGGLR